MNIYVLLISPGMDLIVNFTTASVDTKCYFYRNNKEYNSKDGEVKSSFHHF